MSKKRELLLLIEFILLITMWLLLFYRGLPVLLLILLFVGIVVTSICIYNVFIAKGLEYKKKVQRILREKKWDEFLENSEEDDEILGLARILVSQYSKEISREYLTNVLDKKVQINTLQNQINPHFLYNTMESIRGQATIEGAYEIANMAEALAAFFRYSISQRGSIVTLQDEIDNVQNYFLIQRYRFHNKFSLTVDIDEDDNSVYDYLLPKLTIQPIVENAIFHGLETKGEKGCVTISVKTTQKRLLITISDDGVGMSPEVLDNVAKKLNSTSTDGEESQDKTGTGIALMNVNKRIKLFMGYQYGIVLYSTLNRGTDVEIVLPLVKEKANLLEV